MISTTKEGIKMEREWDRDYIKGELIFAGCDGTTAQIDAALEECKNLINQDIRENLFAYDESYIDSVVENACKNISEKGPKISLSDPESMLYDDEEIFYYLIEGNYWPYKCIVEKGKEFTADNLEDTLHRILDLGGTDEDVKSIMGAEKRECISGIPNDEIFDIDLGYAIPGLLMNV